MQTRSKAVGVGISLLVAFLILATGVFLIGDKEFLFSSSYRLKADFQNVTGLNDGADVRLGGVRAGIVEQINLTPDRKVTVVMKMHNSTSAIIRKDSVASIKTEGILGDKYVDISFGTQAAKVVENGDSIRAEPTVDVSEVANSVAVETKAALATVQEDMEALKQNFLLRGFFQRRGYEDSSELTKHAISQLPVNPPTKQFTYGAATLFDKPDSPKLKNQQALDEAGQFLQGNPFRAAVVAVSAGMVGDSETDRVLTQAQAMEVRDYLVQKFAFDDTLIKTIGFGKAKNPSDSGKVQILVYSSTSTVSGNRKPTPRGH